MLRPDFVRRKLQLITEDLARLERYRHVQHADLEADFVVLATVERLLERIVMRAIDVNRHVLVAHATGREEESARLTYRDPFLQMAGHGVYSEAFAAEIAPSAGLRNILAHDYNDADRRIVQQSISRCLDLYPTYVQQVMAYLDLDTPPATGA
jgi:uncharacterized protein YutE (UPF0331/DUF86 family)